MGSHHRRHGTGWDAELNTCSWGRSALHRVPYCRWTMCHPSPWPSNDMLGWVPSRGAALLCPAPQLINALQRSLATNLLSRKG